MMFTHTMYQRGKRTPAKRATETARTAVSKRIPRNALGNPRMRACHVWATVEHDSTEDTSQPKRVVESIASCHASMDSTKEATRPTAPLTAISAQVRRVHAVALMRAPP